MGHEEIVLPMLVWQTTPKARLGEFETCLGAEFKPNDLSNTSIAGFMAGHDRVRPGVDLQGLFAGHRINHTRCLPLEVVEQLSAMGTAFAFFMETSQSPLEDAYISRCRIVEPDQLAEIHPGLDLASETQQTATALDIAMAFLRATGGEPDYRAIYGDHYCSPAFRRYGDEEQFSCGHAIWIEREGVIRCWSRVIYVPK